jgi:hypothetical protein
MDAPTEAGASLRVRDAGGQEVSFVLPSRSWKRLGSKGFRYKDNKQKHGPCTKVWFKRGKAIRATCTGVRMTLTPPLQAPVELVLRMGNSSYCATLGGQIAQSGGAFVGKGAAAPESCPLAFTP